MNPTMLRPFHPFTEDFFCYAGDQWFAANSKSAATLLAPETDRLLKYFAGRFPPDEAFCPTVLGNEKSLKLRSESKHFIRWEEGHHPRLLGEDDLPAMFASDAHFARKFDAQASVLDCLDSRLGVVNEETNSRHS
ncbi:MAG TPA: hypothetical protein VGG85_16950 [Terracidiphilus sp.]